MLTAPQLSLLRVAKAKLGMDEEAYRATLEYYGGSRSARELDGRGLEAVMARFRQMGFTSDGHARNFGARPGRASPGQVALIRGLWVEAMEAPTDEALNHWLERKFKVSALRFLDDRGAPKAITALRAMVARKAGKAAKNGAERPTV